MPMIDTSALLKRYVNEPGSQRLIELMAEDGEWCACLVAITEARIALRRLLDSPSLEQALENLEIDAGRMVLIPVDDLCLGRAAVIGCEMGLRILVAIHLAAAESLPRPVRFLTFDLRQRQAAAVLRFESIDI